MDFPMQAIIFGLWKTLNFYWIFKCWGCFLLLPKSSSSLWSKISLKHFRWFFCPNLKNAISHIVMSQVSRWYIAWVEEPVISPVINNTESVMKNWIKKKSTRWTKSLCVLIMLHTHFRLNLHSVLAWI